jgi:hypothetical protein
VQRATSIPWRRRWAHIFNEPYSDSGLRLPCSSRSTQYEASTAVMVASHNARLDNGRVSQA